MDVVFQPARDSAVTYWRFGYDPANDWTVLLLTYPVTDV